MLDPGFAYIIYMFFSICSDAECFQKLWCWSPSHKFLICCTGGCKLFDATSRVATFLVVACDDCPLNTQRLWKKKTLNVFHKRPWFWADWLTLIANSVHTKFMLPIYIIIVIIISVYTYICMLVIGKTPLEIFISSCQLHSWKTWKHQGFDQCLDRTGPIVDS